MYSENYSQKYNNEDEVSVFNFISDKKSLKDYLYEQLGAVKSYIKIKKIVSYMIESLDSRGCKEIQPLFFDIKYMKNIKFNFKFIW